MTIARYGASLAATVLVFQLAAGQAAAQAPANETLSATFRGSHGRDVEYQKIAPFKIFDNLYHVGIGSVSTWVIPTTEGLILIDSAQEPFVDHILNNIRNVGFDPKDIIPHLFEETDPGYHERCRPGDVIVGFAGTPVEDARTLGSLGPRAAKKTTATTPKPVVVTAPAGASNGCAVRRMWSRTISNVF